MPDDREWFPTSVRLTPDEKQLLDTIQQDLGVASVAEVLRVALRELARSRGLLVDAAFNQRFRDRY